MIFVALTVTDLDHPVNMTVQKKAVVGNDNDRTCIAEEGILKNVFRFQIQMIGRLIENQQIGILEKDFQQRQSGFFPAREDGNLLMDIIPGKEEGAKEVPLFLVITAGARYVDLLPDGPAVVEILGAFLGKERHTHIEAERRRPGGRIIRTAQNSGQGRFPCSVDTDEGNFFTPVYCKVNGTEHIQISITFGNLS